MLRKRIMRLVVSLMLFPALYFLTVNDLCNKKAFYSYDRGLFY